MHSHRKLLLVLGVVVPVLSLPTGKVWADPQPALQAPKGDQLAEPIAKGQRVFSAGHSFHVFVPRHPERPGPGRPASRTTRRSACRRIGGSRVIQHWDVPDEKNKAKEALRTGKVDVLTLSPIHLPDEGIENFTKLALEHNPNVRVTVQEFWLPFDIYDTDLQEAAQEGGPQRPDRRRAAQAARAVLQEHGRPRPRAEQEARQARRCSWCRSGRR